LSAACSSSDSGVDNEGFGGLNPNAVGCVTSDARLARWGAFCGKTPGSMPGTRPRTCCWIPPKRSESLELDFLADSSAAFSRRRDAAVTLLILASSCLSSLQKFSLPKKSSLESRLASCGMLTCRKPQRYNFRVKLENFWGSLKNKGIQVRTISSLLRITKARPSRTQAIAASSGFLPDLEYSLSEWISMSMS